MLFCFFCLSTPGFAQLYDFSEKPNEFIKDVPEVMNGTKDSSAIKTGQRFVSAWESGQLSESQKDTIINQTHTLADKGYKANPHFKEYFGTIYYALQEDSTPGYNIDSLLHISRRVIQNENKKNLNKFFSTTRLLFETGKLYSSNYNTYYVKGGDFSFDYDSKEEASSAIVDKFDKQSQEEDESDESSGEDSGGGWGSDESSGEDSGGGWGSDDSGEEDSDSDSGGWGDDGWGDSEEDGSDDEGWGSTSPDESDSEDNNDEEEQTETKENTQNKFDVGYQRDPMPETEGPVLKFSSIDLVLKTPHDSVTIYNTSGKYSYRKTMYVADTAKFTWETAGLPDVYSQLGPFYIKLTGTSFEAQDVLLHYPGKLKEPIKGNFKFESKSHANKDQATYPRFKCFRNDIRVHGFGENIIYKGGFSLQGNQIYGYSIDQGKASLQVKREGTTKLFSRAKRFYFKDSVITADPAKITLNLTNEDSITHPGVRLNYNRKTSELRLYESKGKFSNSKYYDSYHQIEIASDVLRWNLKGSKIHFNILQGASKVPATFESTSYYNNSRYRNLQGIFRFHPLQLVVGYARRTGKKEFYLDELAEKYNKKKSALKKGLVNLMVHRYIDFDPSTGYIKIRKKGFHYVYSRLRKKDYDKISIHSIHAGGYNATLNLENNEIEVNGVKRVHISDSSEVDIIPKNKKITMLEGRNIEFDGTIHTANFHYYTNDSRFVYDSFYVRMPDIETIELTMKQEKEDSDQNMQVLGNELKYSSGILYIDDPHNKSGLKHYPAYPKFKATSGATVFFSKESILNGAYDTSVKFTIPPFEADSLSSNNPKAINFEGTFHSGGIFPEFETTLRLMRDNSLGFNYKVPEDGFPLYDNKGRFYNDITLNSQGIRGHGKIEYLTSTLYSKDFVFYQDSVMSVGTRANIKEGSHPKVEEGVTFPELSIKEYDMLWKVNKDSLILSNRAGPFKLYNNTADFLGKITISRQGLHGNGVLNTRGSESASSNFHFQENKYSGQNAFFKILSDTRGKPALESKNVELNFDLDKGKATFSPEVKGQASNNFPFLQYKSSLDRGVWDLEEKTIKMETPKDQDLSNSYFYSTKESQDSLNFNARKAIYDMTEQTLKVYEVPEIKVADGKIIPDSNYVFIRENADMKTLENAEIYLDTLNKYHYLYDGTIDIISRNKFQGAATYQYPLGKEDTLAIEFNEFVLEDVSDSKLRTEMMTVSTANIAAKDSFFIVPQLQYKGYVKMYSRRKILDFKGHINIHTKGDLQTDYWLPYTNTKGEEEILVDAGKGVTSESGANVSSGIHLDKVDLEMYSNLLTLKQHPNDFSYFQPEGKLKHFPKQDVFKIGPPKRLHEEVYEGNIMSYYDKENTVEFEGDLNFLEKENEDIEMMAAGSGKVKLDSAKYSIKPLLVMNFDLKNNAYDIMGERLKESTDSDTITDANENTYSLIYKIANLLNQKEGKKYEEKAANEDYPIMDLDNDLNDGIVISNVEMKWSEENNAWYNTGKIGVANIRKTRINKKLKGYLQIKKTFQGDVIHLYLEGRNNTWFYLSYNSNRVLGLTSSNEEFNEYIQSKQDGKLEEKEKDEYFMIKTDLMEKQEFIRHFKSTYLGEKVEEEPRQMPGFNQGAEKDTMKTVHDSTGVIQDSTRMQTDSTQTQPTKNTKEESGGGF